jgi:hypothetical protein
MKANFRKHKNYDNVYILPVNCKAKPVEYTQEEIAIELLLQEILKTKRVRDLIGLMHLTESQVEFIQDDFVADDEEIGTYRLFIEKINEKDF